MGTVKFVGLDGNVISVNPEGSYTAVKVKKTKYRHAHEKLSCGITLKEDSNELIEKAINVIAGKPLFIIKDSLPWILAYCIKYKALFSSLLANGEPIENLIAALMTSIRQYGNAIYISRLTTAISLIDLIVNGKGYHSSSHLLSPMDGLVNNELDLTAGSKAHTITCLASFIDSGSFKSSMTRSYFKGTLLSFSPPAGEVYTLCVHKKKKEFSHNDSLMIRLDSFPNSYYEDYEGFGVYGYPGVSSKAINFPFNPDFSGKPISQERTFESEFPMRADAFSHAEFHVPHNWITHISEYTENGIQKFTVPNHKYIEGDASCLSVLMPTPSVDGKYSDDIRTAVACFSFIEQGLHIPYPGKSFTAKELRGFLKSKEPTKKFQTIREMSDLIIHSTCIYYVETINCWNAINRIVPHSTIRIYHGEDQSSSKNIAVCFSKGMGRSIIVLNPELSAHLVETDQSIRSFKHDEESLNTLYNLIGFSYPCTELDNIFNVVNSELQRGKSYQEYSKSREFMTDIHSF